MKRRELKINLTGNFEKVTFQGEPHVVAPCVMLTPGVHHGSCGPLLYNADEIAKSAHLWNGVDVLLDHAYEGGNPVSAKDPKVLEAQGVGRVYDARMDGGSLKAKLYLNINRTNGKSPGLINMLDRHIEVSTGLMSSDEPTPGVWNGESYSAIVRDIRPDHLALLPNGQGACSWVDGCGIRANKGNGDDEMNLNESEEPLSLPQYHDDLESWHPTVNVDPATGEEILNLPDHRGYAEFCANRGLMEIPENLADEFALFLHHRHYNSGQRQVAVGDDGETALELPNHSRK
jgi:hypothetical protein